MKILDCSINGYEKLSPLIATVKLYGKELTIAEHVESCIKKMTIDNKEYAYLEIGGKEINPNLLPQFHSALWVKFFDSNPKIEEFIRKNKIRDFESTDQVFFDNIHLDIITKFIRIGRYAVVRDFKELKSILANESHVSYKKIIVEEHKVDEESLIEVKAKKKPEIISKLKLNPESSISLMKINKPMNPDKVIRIFSFKNEKFKIVEKESKIMAFKVKRSNVSKVPVSIFDISKLKNMPLSTIQSSYSTIIDKNNFDISQKSLRAITKEVYNYINKR